MTQRRTVFFVSDGTGITAQMLGHSLLTQFEGVEFDQVNQPLSPLFWIELRSVIRQLRTAGYRLAHRERANFLFVHRAALPRAG